MERATQDEREKPLATSKPADSNGSVNWRTISVFFGIIIVLLTILNYANARAVGPPAQAFVTNAEYKGHVEYAKERYEMMNKRLDEIALYQKEILRELRSIK